MSQISYSLGSLLSIQDISCCVQILSKMSMISHNNTTTTNNKALQSLTGTAIGPTKNDKWDHDRDINRSKIVLQSSSSSSKKTKESEWKESEKKKRESREPQAIWIPETWGMESFAIQGMVASHTAHTKIGSSIINTYSRSPALVAMGAATIDTISNGRAILGLGTSSPPIIQDFHGLHFENPVSRTREYIEIIKKILNSKGPIKHAGTHFKLKNFQLLIKPPRKKIPIYLAAVNKNMVDLAWDIADGVIFYMRPQKEMKKTIQKMQSKKRIKTTSQIITCVSHNSESAVTRAKKTLSFYIAVGSIYRRFLAQNGYNTETTNIYDEYKKTGLKNLESLVTNTMLHDLAICGTPNEVQKQLKKFQGTGIDLPILQFNPPSDGTVATSNTATTHTDKPNTQNIKKAFKLFHKTFSDVT